MVFDAAAVSKGMSLNSALIAGPDVNIPLTRLLFQFRMGPIGVCGDIREMFHQVHMREEDQQSKRFLWRDGIINTPPDVYVMRVMTFGATCSPASAQHVKNTNALEFQDEMPDATNAILQHHYVDDYVASFNTPEDAARITKQVIEVHRRSGFDLRGIVTNDASVQSQFGEHTEGTIPLNK